MSPTPSDPLFPGFETGRLKIDDAEIYYRTAGDGPPLLLLHGFPQTGAMWAGTAPDLAADFRVVVPDLRGYGRSTGPAGGPDRYAKRVMAADMIALMAHLGATRFTLVGHDRGGRVGYRLALDHPDRLNQLAVLDILPTYEYWASINRQFALNIFHWAFLAQPHPYPETMIGAAPEFFIDEKLKKMIASHELTAIAPLALEEYRDNARHPERLRAMCDDYRAGAGIDVECDAADLKAGRKIQVPTLALWGAAGIAPGAADPLETWRRWCVDVRGEAIDCGHHLPEENPADSLAALRGFLLAPR